MECYISADGTLVLTPLDNTEEFAVHAWEKAGRRMAVQSHGATVVLGEENPQQEEDNVVAGVDQETADIAGPSAIPESEVAEDTVVVESMTRKDLLAKLKAMPEAKGKFTTKDSHEKLKMTYLTIINLNQIAEEDKGQPEETKDLSHTELCDLFKKYLTALNLPDQPACDKAGMAMLKKHGVKKLSDLVGVPRAAFIKETMELVNG
jgi:hypothetical protein